jgi:hypothetical protein
MVDLPVERTLVNSVRDYLDYAEVYTSESDIDRIRDVFESHREVFVRDGLSDWVHLTLNHLPKNMIKRLSCIYQVMNLHDLTHLLGWIDIAETEAELRKLIEQRIVLATIDLEHHLVTFTGDYQEPPPGHYSSDLEDQENRLRLLIERTRIALNQLHSHSLYLEAVKTFRQDGSHEFGGGGEEEEVDEESIMSDNDDTNERTMNNNSIEEV